VNQYQAVHLAGVGAWRRIGVTTNLRHGARHGWTGAGRPSEGCASWRLAVCGHLFGISGEIKRTDGGPAESNLCEERQPWRRSVGGRVTCGDAASATLPMAGMRRPAQARG